MWWLTSVIPAEDWKTEEKDPEFKASLSCIASLGPAQGTTDPVSEIQSTQKLLEEGQHCSLMAEYLLGMHKALGLSSTPQDKERGGVRDYY